MMISCEIVQNQIIVLATANLFIEDNPRPPHYPPRPALRGFLLFTGHTIHRTPPTPHALHTPRTGHHTHRPTWGRGNKNLTTY